MSGKKRFVMAAAGIVIGMALAGPGAEATEAYLKAVRSTQAFYMDGQRIQMESYTINGSNYVKLRDVGEALGFNVYWDGAVQIDSDAPYTGTGPVTDDGVGWTPADSSRYIPQVGDVIRCGDGSDYTITDVSRYDANMFADGSLGPLPEPTCDWSQFDQPELPAAEARRFQTEAGDYLFLRNLYETRRMLYTLYNAMGENEATWANGSAVLREDGTPWVHIELTMPEDLTAYPFWPWREDQVTAFFHSRPGGTFYLEVWDVFADGIFQRTEYNIRAR